MQAAATSTPGGIHAGSRHRPDGALFGHAGDVRNAAVRGAPRVVVTTPYYVPNDSLQSALCTTAYRGVDTTIVFPTETTRGSRVQPAAATTRTCSPPGSRSQYEGGLPHQVAHDRRRDHPIGSANMDRRSFDLNYENNILFHDRALTGVMRERQQSYIVRSHPVTAEMVAAWPMRRRLWNNLIATLGPVL